MRYPLRFELTDNDQYNKKMPISDKITGEEEMSLTEVEYLLNTLNDESKYFALLVKKLDKEVWSNHLEVQSVLFSHALGYNRDSKEFNLIKDIAKDLHCTISLMGAADDEE